MKQTKLFYFEKGIFLLLIIVGLASGSPPENPCPQVFQYKFDGIDWIGLIQLDNVTKDESVNIIVKLSVPISLPTVYKGSLSVLEENSIFQGKQLLYKITFPVQNPIARVTNIIVNNAVICSGPPDQNPEMTSFDLYHVLYPMVSTTAPNATQSFTEIFWKNLLNESKKIAEETPG